MLIVSCGNLLPISKGIILQEKKTWLSSLDVKFEVNPLPESGIDVNV